MTEVELRLIRTDQPAELVEELWESLDVRERARVAGALPVVRSRFTVVRGVVRRLVAARLGVRPAEVVWRRGRHGKPEPVGAGELRVNWSASEALAVLAITEGRPVGVDVERVPDARAAERMAARWFPFEEARFVAEPARPAERAERFTGLWCRREACVKAYGGRLAQSLGVSVAGPSPLLLADPGPLGEGPVRLCDVPVPGPYRAAVAVLGASPIHVNSLVWHGS
ncbi:4'-phosphopantetheinyl transferase superfamily protein [Streptomyces sp. FH025]|uniref:4'-phosphopantetheinyl transferase family protein n=1 Tax=Streptomyces sp. FH025 TaxID=2815937 RepID=UPI001A9EECB9|nr:4'-phosphopantetheinyl transferase superfamily protein [Streptomyces sp. FH025]MBO1415177.1 4'-phosphopantetheinyl transferase superfamily protein [Streptomyces sp. FH025]